MFLEFQHYIFRYTRVMKCATKYHFLLCFLSFPLLLGENPATKFRCTRDGVGIVSAVWNRTKLSLNFPSVCVA